MPGVLYEYLAASRSVGCFTQERCRRSRRDQHGTLLLISERFAHDTLQSKKRSYCRPSQNGKEAKRHLLLNAFPLSKRCVELSRSADACGLPSDILTMLSSTRLAAWVLEIAFTL